MQRVLIAAVKLHLLVIGALCVDKHGSFPLPVVTVGSQPCSTTAVSGTAVTMQQCVAPLLCCCNRIDLFAMHTSMALGNDTF
jgi:hypothetical protein